MGTIAMLKNKPFTAFVSYYIRFKLYTVKGGNAYGLPSSVTKPASALDLIGFYFGKVKFFIYKLFFSVFKSNNVVI